MVVPVYNAADVIERCLDSVLAQTLDGVEVICVDDESSDDSLEILRRYEREHPGQVRVLTQTNQGQGATRNRGMDVARGTYLAFLDNDDYLDPDFLERCYRQLEDTGADVVCCGYRRVEPDGRVLQERLPVDGPFFPYSLVAPWSKVYRRALVADNQITFPAIVFGEDSVFTVRVLDATDKVTVVACAGYVWLNTPTSTSNVLMTGLDNVREPVRELLTLLTQVPGRSPSYEYYYIKNAIFLLLHLGRVDPAEVFVRHHRELMAQVADTVRHPLRRAVFGPRGDTWTIRTIVAVYMLVHRAHLTGLFARVYAWLGPGRRPGFQHLRGADRRRAS